MTDQSKPTTDMPDVIYARHWGSCWQRKIEDFTFTRPEYPEVKYIRADLVPAAPTGQLPGNSRQLNGDKAAALADFTHNMKVRKGFPREYIEVTMTHETYKTVISSLQENTAPDDLVKALGILKPYVPFLRISDEERTFLNAFFESHKEKTQVQE